MKKVKEAQLLFQEILALNQVKHSFWCIVKRQKNCIVLTYNATIDYCIDEYKLLIKYYILTIKKYVIRKATH